LTAVESIAVRVFVVTVLSVAAYSLLPLAAACAGTAGSPWWGINSTVATNPVERPGEAQLSIIVSNLGDGEVTASEEHPVAIMDELPVGMEATAIEARAGVGENGAPVSCEAPPTIVVTCEFTKTLLPYEQIFLHITARLEAPQSAATSNTVRVSGANTRTVSLTKQLRTHEGKAQFGVETYEVTPEEEGGALDTQAGSHPFQLRTTLDFNQTLGTYGEGGKEGEYYSKGEEGEYPTAPALPQNLRLELPPGLVADATAVPSCPESEFAVETNELLDTCSPDTAIGVASVLINDPILAGFNSLKAVPVFNLVPAPGEPARFGFYVEGVTVVIRTAVPSGGEYNAEATVNYASQAAQILSSQVVLWGVPGDSRHDSSRGWECVVGGTWEDFELHKQCLPLGESDATALLTLPTSCERPLVTTLEGDSWTEQELKLLADNEHPPKIAGCEVLSKAFKPSMTVQPEGTSASTPTGLNTNVEVPQSGLLSGQGLSSPAVRDTTVSLPEGLQLNPSAANGLRACSLRAVGYKGRNEQTGIREFYRQNARALTAAQEQQEEREEKLCPAASKVGTVEIETPILRDKVSGGVYLAEPAPNGEGGKNPFNSLVALYIVAEDPTLGILGKIAGE
jgi:hypothetical protein